MRKLGAMLGVEAMSLYNHVENKGALFDGVIEVLVLQTAYSEMPDATPRDELWAYIQALRKVLRAHPRALPLVATNPFRTPATLTVFGSALSDSPPCEHPWGSSHLCFTKYCRLYDWSDLTRCR